MLWYVPMVFVAATATHEEFRYPLDRYEALGDCDAERLIQQVEHASQPELTFACLPESEV